jgi:hypothetical protein
LGSSQSSRLCWQGKLRSVSFKLFLNQRAERARLPGLRLLAVFNDLRQGW